MKYTVLSKESFTRAEKRRLFIKWALYSLCLMLLYVFMRSGAMDKWQPILIIPLAAAVSMDENELPSCVFAMFCGFMIDIACNNIFGFSAVWLMAVCLASSLLVRNLIRVNLFNFCAVSFTAILLQFSMDYLFNVAIWGRPGGEIIFTASMLPSAVSTFILSPAIYYLVRLINKKFGEAAEGKISYNETRTEDEEGAEE
ncbi:MAG: hypothetical protein ACI4KR_11660 [Ruminiclostridium sp.]